MLLAQCQSGFHLLTLHFFGKGTKISIAGDCNDRDEEMIAELLKVLHHIVINHIKKWS